jgi:predicted anti-sigma-YlaC factor YlaD
MSCEQSSHLQRYHDGELPMADRAAVEAHLCACASCRELLADLGRLSSVIAKAAMKRPSAEAVRRMQVSWRAARDRGVIRLAGWLTAAAAALLMAVLLGKPGTERIESAGQTAMWETVAVAPPAENDEDDGSELLAMAQWMADDLSATSRQ